MTGHALAVTPVRPDTGSPFPYSLIDHTCLTPDADANDIVSACRIAVLHSTATVCVRPEWVRLSARTLMGTPVGITTVVAFPDGIASAVESARETDMALRHGATEIDMVINPDSLHAGTPDAYAHLTEHITAVRNASVGRTLKVILETAALTEYDIRVGALLAADCGADYVKTSTGYHPAGGATLHAVRLLAEAVPHLGVKASGGIRTHEDIAQMVDAGATRIGTSNTAALDTADMATGY